MVAADSCAGQREDLAKPNTHSDGRVYFEEHYDETKAGAVSVGAVV
jgi:hypothetical protein